jgi:hypothetical protein
MILFRVSDHADESLGSSSDSSKSIANHPCIIRFPRREIERRPTRVEAEIPPDDVGDRLRFDFAFRTLCVITDVRMQEYVGELVNECPCEICPVRPIPNLDEWSLGRVSPIVADPLSASVGPVFGRDESNSYVECVTGVDEGGNECIAIACRDRIEFWKWLAFGL